MQYPNPDSYLISSAQFDLSFMSHPSLCPAVCGGGHTRNAEVQSVVQTTVLELAKHPFSSYLHCNATKLVSSKFPFHHTGLIDGMASCSLSSL